MFESNQYHVTNNSAPNYPQNVHVHIAPTDKSIELYEEIKTKAYSSIIESFSLKDNTVNFDGIIYKDYLRMDCKCAGVFKINNKDFKFEFDVTDFYDDKDKILLEIYNKISNELSRQFMMSRAKDINEIFRNFKG